MPSDMPVELASHLMDLLWCVAPKIDDVISAMPTLAMDINRLKLSATARCVLLLMGRRLLT